jgi:hypothetical protein
MMDPPRGQAGLRMMLSHRMAHADHELTHIALGSTGSTSRGR